MKNKKLYPIEYKGKTYTKKQCDPTFQGYYSCLEALRDDKCVYIANGEWIYPDGEFTT